MPMNTAKLLLLNVLGGGGSSNPRDAYAEKVATLFGSSRIAHYPLWESEGPYAMDYTGQHGDAVWLGNYYSSVDVTLGADGIGDGRTGARFAWGPNAGLSIDGTSYKAAFNGAEGSAIIWAKVSSAEDWVDGSGHCVLQIGGGANHMVIGKNSTNQLEFRYTSAWSQKQYNMPSVSTADWMCLGITWSKSADEVKFYMNGAQVSTTRTGLAEWGAASPVTCIGTETIEGPVVSGWKGTLAHWILLNRAATPAEMAAVAVLPAVFGDSEAVAVAPAVVKVPSGGDIPAALATMRMGDVLELEAGGVYTVASGQYGFSGIPFGHPMRHTTVRGNGATISGGAIAIGPGATSYLTFENLNVGAAQHWSLLMTNSRVVRFTDCTFHNPATGTTYDTCRFDNCYDFVLTRCTATSTTDYDSPRAHDGFELWGPCEDFTFIECVAHDFINGSTQNEGHGFEIYGGDANDLCQNVRFINCEAYNCQVGFSVEGGPDGLDHVAVICDGCSSHDNAFYGYQGVDGSTLQRVNVSGHDNSGNGVSETSGDVDDLTSLTYVLRDLFTTTEAAPITTPRNAEPGPGSENIYDSGNKVSIADSRLVVKATTSTRLGARVEVGRVAGRAIFFNCTELFGTPMYGLNSSNAFDAIANLYYAVQSTSASGQNISLSMPGAAASHVLAYSTQYDARDAAIVLDSVGARLFFFDGLAWRLRWRWPDGSATPLYAVLSGGTLAGLQVDALQIRDLPAPMDTAFAASVVNEASPASGTPYSGAIEGIHDLTLTAPDPLADSAGLRYRVLDANNYATLYLNSTGALRMDTVTGGVATNRVNVAGVASAGATLTIRVIIRVGSHSFYTLSGSTWTYHGLFTGAINDLSRDIVPVATGGWVLGGLRSDPNGSNAYMELYRTVS